MATLVYDDTVSATLSGGSGSDLFVIDITDLGTNTATLVDAGGSDTLRLVDPAQHWGTKSLVNINGHLTWRGLDGGVVFIPLEAGKPGIEYLEWGATLDAAESRLHLVTDLMPASGGSLAVVGTNGADRIVMPSDGATAHDHSEIYGGNGADTITASGVEHTRVFGGRGADLVASDGPASVEFYGEGGRDILWGCGGNDRLYGGYGKDELFGSEGSDSLYGGKGKDLLQGGEGSDDLRGGKGRDMIEGGGGSDWIDGGRFSDTLTGGKGADIFHFNATRKEGRDVITDFRVGSDHLEISGGSYDDLVFGTSNSGDAKISLPPGSVIILEGVAPADISADIFDFL